MSTGYDYTRESIWDVAIKMQFPERSAEESKLIWAFLQHHGHEYDRYSVSVRVGAGVAPDPSHLPGVQRQTVRNSQPRIDLVAWSGAQPTIFEVKQRAIHHAIGQVITYRHLWMEDNPGEPEPRLAVIARTIEPFMEPVFQAAGVTVYLYPEAAGDRGATSGGLQPNNGETA